MDERNDKGPANQHTRQQRADQFTNKTSTNQPMEERNNNEQPINAWGEKMSTNELTTQRKTNHWTS